AITNLQRKFDKLLFFYLFIWVGNFSKVTTYLKKYSVKADYTITMTYRNGNEANDREVKFKGSWYGIINTTSKAKPDEIVTIPLEEYMKSLSNNNLQ
ncbi:hypothetical protein AAH040_21720, partial [Phocaeicola dorei]